LHYKDKSNSRHQTKVLGLYSVKNTYCPLITNKQSVINQTVWLGDATVRASGLRFGCCRFNCRTSKFRW